MGHHFNEKREFQSDKHPKNKPDRITINMKKPASQRAAYVLAEDYREIDSGFSEDIFERLEVLGYVHGDEP